MKVLEGHFEMFKGVKDSNFRFKPDIQVIRGKNGTGKTTIYDGFIWTITDKDSRMISNPEIHPDGMSESEPSVSWVCEINGKIVTIRKYQTDMRTKKQKEDGAPVRISNKYEINGVPKTQKDFYKALSDYGINVDKFLMLVYADYFCNMKKEDQRTELFNTTTDVTDLDVAKSIPECKDAEELLKEGYTREEITATNKTKQKRSKDQMDALPNQIIGMEKSKVEVDPQLDDRKAHLSEEIAKAQEQLEEMLKKADTAEIDKAIRAAELEKVTRHNEANAERLKTLEKAQKYLSQVQNEYLRAYQDRADYITKGERINDFFRASKERIASLKEERKAIMAEKFVAGTCPTCGQMMPKERAEASKQKWQISKEQRLKENAEKTDLDVQAMDSYRTKGKELAAKKKEADKAFKTAEAARKKAKESVDALSKAVKPDCSDIDAKIADLQKQKSAVNEYSARAYELRRDIAGMKTALEDIVKRQAAELNNTYIDERIEEMQRKLKEYAQAKADAEKILYQMQLISSLKNNLLSDEVNKHFTKVRFRLFREQKDGQIKDDCTPLVLCSDGKYRPIDQANTAAVVAAKLDICAGLQKFYGQDLPVFLDGAECLDEKNRAELKMDNQLILLCVSDDERLVFE